VTRSCIQSGGSVGKIGNDGTEKLSTYRTERAIAAKLAVINREVPWEGDR